MELSGVASLALRSGWALLLIALLAVPVGAEADAVPEPAPANAPRVIAAWVDVGPDIDGVLDDPMWANATPMGPLTQVQPVQGARPSRATEVRILTDADNLYVGVRCYDPDPAGIIARNMLRDGDTDGEDRVTFVLDTFHDRRNGYLLQTNPLGIRVDGLVEDARFAREWDGIWNVKTRIDAQGWTAEFVIPYKTLNFAEGRDTWGFNFSRQIRGTQEDVRWADPDQNRNLLNLGRAGAMEGLSRARQGIGLDVVPATTVRRVDDQRTLRDESRPRHYTRITPSLDVRYKITPSLTATGTANTDFGETPVDDVQVNLGPAATFFPEKREFFLQDLGIFDFGNIQIDAQPFFSRTIGLSLQGDPVPIRGGGKLSGRQGPLSVGALVVHQKDQNHVGSEDDVEAKTVAVTRVKLNLGAESNVGLIGTYGDPQNDRDNWLVGADATYRTTKLFGDSVFQATAWYQRSHTYNDDGLGCLNAEEQPNDCDSENAYGLELQYPNDRVNWQFVFQDIEEDFLPGLGFVRRGNTKRYRGSYRYRWRPETEVQIVDSQLFAWVLTESDRPERVTEMGFRQTLVDIQSQVGDRIGTYVAFDFRREQLNRLVFDNVVLPNGKYSFETGGVFIEATRSRPLSGGIEVFGGTFYDGYRVVVEPRIEWRPTRALLFAASYSHQRHWGLSRAADDALCNDESDVIPQECGNSFTVHIATGRFEVQFSPDLSWNNLVQYDNNSDEMSFQSRVRWTITPGSDLFLILGQGFEATHDTLKAGRTEPLVKLSWTFRF